MPTAVPTHSRKRIFFRWLRYLPAGFLILLLALVSAGAIYEAIESHRDRQRFHPPGRMWTLAAIVCIFIARAKALHRHPGGR